MKPPFSRPRTTNEKLYLAGRHLLPPFAIQVVVEGHGTLSVPSLEKAVARTSNACPGANLTLSGRSWISGDQSPPVSEFDHAPNSLADSPRLRQPLSPSDGPTAEVLISRDGGTLIFRAFHGSMDGRGALRWAEEIFRALRDESPLPASSGLTDTRYRNQLVHQLGSPGRRPSTPSDLPHPLRCSPPPAPPTDVNWLRRTVHGHPQALVAKVAEIIAAHSHQNARFMVPVDLRRHGEGDDSTANLTLPIFLETTPGIPWEPIQESLLTHLYAHSELAHDPLEKWVNLLPVPLLKTFARFAQKRQSKISRYPISAILSHLGKVDLNTFSTPDFEAATVYTLPVHAPLIPLSFTFVESGTHTEICLSCDRDPASLDASKALLEKISNAVDTPKTWSDWVGNQTDTPFAEDRCIHELFAEQARKTPEKTALLEGANTLTYAQLDRLSTRLAADFLANGIAPGHLVAVLVNRSLPGIAAILGVLKAGAAYLPLDPTYPPEFLSATLTESRVTHGILEPAHRQLAGSIAAEIDWLEPTGSDQKITPVSSPRSDAYVIYTSGSSGKPKGVAITHRSLTNYAQWAANHYEIGGSSRFALFTSLAFDLSVTAIFPPLISGGSIELFPQPFDPQVLTAVLEGQCNSLKLTPAHLDLLNSLFSKPTQLDLLVVGGEQLSTTTALNAHKNFGAKIFNEYGPTEATVGCIIHRFSPTHDAARSSVPIGRPGANQSVRLLDQNLDEVPFGEPGEICISGQGLARCYLHSPQQSESSFITLSDGTRAYRTGDLAKIDSHGNLQFLGRIDSQIKVRGFRIEPATVENALLATGAVSDAVVIGQNNALIAFVIPKADHLSDLRSTLANTLPAHLIPTEFISVPGFPLTPNGKIDLATLQGNRASNPTSHPISPSSPLEFAISKIWTQSLILPQDSFSPDSNFHHLGGDSLAFLQMLIAVSKLCDDSAAFMKQTGSILNDPTLAEVARIALLCKATPTK